MLDEAVGDRTDRAQPPQGGGAGRPPVGDPAIPATEADPVTRSGLPTTPGIAAFPAPMPAVAPIPTRSSRWTPGVPAGREQAPPVVDLARRAGVPSSLDVPYGRPVGRVPVAPGFSRPALRSSVTSGLVTAVAAPVTAAVLATVAVAIEPDIWWIALLVVVVGAVVGILGSVSLWRRLREEVEEPAEALRFAAARMAAGEPGLPTNVDHGALAPLAAALDSAELAISRRTGRLERQAEWGEASAMIIEALEFAQDETEAFDVASRALALADSDRPVEMLASTGQNQRLVLVAEHSERGGWGCPVDSGENCLALRRGQVVVTDSSLALNACPRLRENPGGACSAVCMPVGVAGRSIGVLTAVGPDRVPPDLEYVDRLTAIARQVGNRVDSLRALEQSREEAATDGLTGLSLRRVLESQLEQMLERGVEFIAVLADLDKFKNLNDTYGHEVGDRALRLFSQVLQQNVRGHDLLARVGGEEFVAVYPDMSVQRSLEAIQRLQSALAEAVSASGLPAFTCAFGVTHSSVGSSVSEILRVADAGLLRAKQRGGNQVVYADKATVGEVFGSNGGGAADAGGLTERG